MQINILYCFIIYFLKNNIYYSFYLISFFLFIKFFYLNLKKSYLNLNIDLNNLFLLFYITINLFLLFYTTINLLKLNTNLKLYNFFKKLLYQLYFIILI